MSALPIYINVYLTDSKIIRGNDVGLRVSIVVGELVSGGIDFVGVIPAVCDHTTLQNKLKGSVLHLIATHPNLGLRESLQYKLRDDSLYKLYQQGY